MLVVVAGVVAKNEKVGGIRYLALVPRRLPEFLPDVIVFNDERLPFCEGQIFWWHSAS